MLKGLLTVNITASHASGLTNIIEQIRGIPGVENIVGATEVDDDTIETRVIDALQRLDQGLLNEIAIEVRDAASNAASNGYADDIESLKDHLTDLYQERVNTVLLAEYQADRDELRDAWEVVMDWAFGPHALDDVHLSDEDCTVVRRLYEAEFNPVDVKDLFFAVADAAVRNFVEERLPDNLSGMSGEVYDWLGRCRVAGSWLPASSVNIEVDPRNCPSCFCAPGDGPTSGCTDPIGCGRTE